MKEELHNKEIKDLTNHVKHLNTLDDFDKLNYLKDLQEKDIEFEIRIDNDAVYIFFGYDAEGDSIGCSFREFGYHLLPALFNFIGFESDFY